MAIQTFNSYLEDLGGAAIELRLAKDRLAGLLSRHNSAGFSTLSSGAFTGRPVTKAQYDSLMSSVNNLINTWWTSGNGTNIENYLTENPGP